MLQSMTKHFSLLVSPYLCALATLAFISSTFGTEPRSIADLLGQNSYSEVSSTGKLIRISASGKPSMLPFHEASKSIRADIESEQPGILVEAVFTLSRPAPASQEAAAAELASIYGLLRSVGSLEGIEYYSQSRKKMRTFYAESYRIEGPKGTVRIADPPFPAIREIPVQETLFVFQRDLSFGANRYKYIFENAGDAVTVKAVNLTRMYYGILPVFAPGALTTRLLIVPASDGIIFYAVSWAHAPGMMKSKIRDSFGNRAEALFRWFVDKSKGFVKQDSSSKRGSNRE
jgi:hypothetical protein